MQILPQYNTGERNIYALYPTRKLLPIKVRRLVDFLARALERPVWQQPAEGEPTRPAAAL